MTLASLLHESAARKPRHVAVYWGNARIRYADLESRIRALAGHLSKDFGVQRGDRVAILLRNCPEFIVALYAVYSTGATAVPLNTFLKAGEIRYILEDCNTRLLISSADFADTLKRAQETTPRALWTVLEVGGSRWTECLAPLPDQTLPEVGAGDLALLVYTSGTTGHPKGVMLTHANLAGNVKSCIECLHAVERDRLLLALPMFHSFMLTVGIALPLSAGASIVMVRSLQPFKPVLKEILLKRVTIFLGIPQLYQALAHAKIPWWFHWLCSIRLAISGSAPLPVETLDLFSQKFRFPLVEGYGLSEASPVVSLNPIHGVKKAGSVGLPIPDVEIKILDDNDKEMPVGEVGEVCVRGPNVMKGYYNQPEQTAEALRNGWLHTGDLGKQDSDGYTYIVDRKKDMLLVHGNNVYPREIEEVIYQIAGVKEAAVIGRPDKHGEVPVAFVVAADGAKLDEQTIRAFCKERLADYKLPRDVRRVEQLPRNATGKIDKKQLRSLL